jgi:hypothetical protein
VRELRRNEEKTNATKKKGEREREKREKRDRIQDRDEAWK